MFQHTRVRAYNCVCVCVVCVCARARVCAHIVMRIHDQSASLWRGPIVAAAWESMSCSNTICDAWGVQTGILLQLLLLEALESTYG